MLVREWCLQSVGYVISVLTNNQRQRYFDKKDRKEVIQSFNWRKRYMARFYNIPSLAIHLQKAAPAVPQYKHRYADRLAQHN